MKNITAEEKTYDIVGDITLVVSDNYDNNVVNENDEDISYYLKSRQASIVDNGDLKRFAETLNQLHRNGLLTRAV